MLLGDVFLLGLLEALFVVEEELLALLVVGSLILQFSTKSRKLILHDLNSGIKFNFCFFLLLHLLSYCADLPIFEYNIII